MTNLLEWSHSQLNRIDLKPEHFFIGEIITETFALLHNNAVQKSIILSNLLPEDMTVLAERTMLSTVFRNLISNAIKFTNTGGKIEIYTLPQKDFIEFIVSDNGVGMEKEISDKLFRMDTTITTQGTQNEIGSGLGLILCKEFVEKQGGKIWVESQPGYGSKFHFTLPAENHEDLDK